jgi:hypothetical protein
MDFLGWLVPLLLVILVVEVGLITLKLDTALKILGAGPK